MVTHHLNAFDASNACGLYYKSNNGLLRPVGEDNQPGRNKRLCRRGNSQRKSGFVNGPVTASRNFTCSNCKTNETVLWRKGPEGRSPLCNPCGLFYKLHGTHRSPEKRKKIHRRNRKRPGIRGKTAFLSGSESSERDYESGSPGSTDRDITRENNCVKEEGDDRSSDILAHYRWFSETVSEGPGPCLSFMNHTL